MLSRTGDVVSTRFPSAPDGGGWRGERSENEGKPATGRHQTTALDRGIENESKKKNVKEVVISESPWKGTYSRIVVGRPRLGLRRLVWVESRVAGRGKGMHFEFPQLVNKWNLFAGLLGDAKNRVEAGH